MKYLLLITLIFYSTVLLAFDKIEYLSENNAPYNYRENGEAKGISVDILTEVARVLGVDIKPTAIKFSPWAWAYREAQSPNKKNMIFTITRTPSRENLFQWAGPFIYGRSAVFGRASAEKISSIKELYGKKIGVIRDDVAESRLLSAGIKKTDIIELNSKEQLFSMLMKKRFDYFSHGELTTYHALKKSKKYSKKDVKVVYINSRGGLYFGFNKSVDKEMVVRFREALLKVLADKDFMENKIYRKYY